MNNEQKGPEQSVLGADLHGELVTCYSQAREIGYNKVIVGSRFGLYRRVRQRGRII
jgi:hypothetical protein